MKNFITLTLLVFGCVSSYAQKKTELELITLKQLFEYTYRYDLSGISHYKDSIFVVADKKDNPFIYQVNWDIENFTVSPIADIPIKGKIDLEGIAIGGDIAYLINESNNEVYTLNLQSRVLNKLLINWQTLESPKKEWLHNAGFEGVAIDVDKNVLYLAKERQPKLIIKIDLKSLEIIEVFKTSNKCSNDYADLCFYEGYLYALERNGMCIVKIDPKNNKEIAHYSFRKSVSNKGERLYEPVKYGMAEALMVKNNEIWVGFDNNGVSVSEFGKSKYGLTGSAPILLKFKLPSK
ncbi:SdiA-regulated domain-containing protein [Flammeovirga pectinis]|uniref:SdiA-regulated domain-containing protein n=1 Tax=Flammeovirga pectinis TaxID=2494373 RepID=UPI00147746F4|nr:SdiA-regulated domain-containing protein [Flammeovirga pectinis]